MKTYQEKIKDSFGDSIKHEELDENLIDYFLENIINQVYNYERDGNTDLNNIAKKITNNLISEAEKYDY